MNKKDVKKRVNMSKELLKRLKQKDIPILSFVIFGSTGRGTAKDYSDIDILIIVKEKTNIIWRTLIDESRNIEDAYGLSFSFIFTTRERLCENPLILLDMTDECIVLYDHGSIFKSLVEKLKSVLKRFGSKKTWIDAETWYWEIKPDWKPGEVVEIKL
jgi:predicted nucleotidyltransferase